MTELIPSEVLAFLAKHMVPRPEGTRTSIREMRRSCRLTRGQMAALLGGSMDTLRRWEAGTRNPSAAARRLVQLVERLYFSPGRLVESIRAYNILNALVLEKHGRPRLGESDNA